MILMNVEYLRGQEKDNKECANLFKDYQQCLQVNFEVLEAPLSLIPWHRLL